MSTNSRDSEKLKNYRRRLENPYAYSELVDEAEQTSEPKILAEEQRSSVYVLEDPYASLYEKGNGEKVSSTPTAVERPSIRNTISKREFRTRCSGIFRPYVPPLEKGRLRPHHKAFIERN